ncbi:MAG: Bifunctional chorismate mutase/prephenate dehydratase [Chroococcopsis gigantea SAG 12.99]|jgi:prephenate dehydratase|nr:prephenate dehydratase [Chlorogloea purpurea SAG 13.99]MDV3002081.1 Bifunctional chorismate mutase/prephenate dehydratase [Chroococcopsis gigantea SAG 12.99]
MARTIAHLGPTGTNAETAALIYKQILGESAQLRPYNSINQSVRSVAGGETDLAVIPVENSTEGSVVMTLDSLWQYDRLQIQLELVLPITHSLLSRGRGLEEVKSVYSHPQALAQCQQWLENNLPDAAIIPTNSTTEAIVLVKDNPGAAAIAAPRAAKLYNFPILVELINDYADNCTRFWVVGLKPITEGRRVSLAFSVPANVPGALVKPLEVFARRGLNLSRIESRPTKRSLGEYVFFMDIESLENQPHLTRSALEELSAYTEVVKVLGHYEVREVDRATVKRIS